MASLKATKCLIMAYFAWMVWHNQVITKNGTLVGSYWRHVQRCEVLSDCDSIVMHELRLLQEYVKKLDVKDKDAKIKINGQYYLKEEDGGIVDVGRFICLDESITNPIKIPIPEVVPYENCR